MSNKNTWQGLQFRILETLEAHHAPLTAIEIAAALHATEYQAELKDNVIFKVTRAVHSMKDMGKIILSEARGPAGQLCYELPTRLRFPPRDKKPPVNPVLTPEVAAQIKTVELKEPKKMGKRDNYVYGIQNAIVKLLDESAHPMTSLDITNALKHMYPAELGEEKHKLIFAGHLHNLSKGAHRQIFARKPAVKYMKNLKFEYFTRKTGSEPHPLQVKMEKRAPRPSEAWPQYRPAMAPSQVDSEPPAIPLKPATPSSGGFRPVRVEDVRETMTFLATPAQKKQILHLADGAGITASEFIAQAVDYALSRVE